MDWLTAAASNVSSSTVANNTATAGGAAVQPPANSVTNLSNVTIAGNWGASTTPGRPSVSLTSAIRLSRPTRERTVLSLPTSQGNNLSSDGTCRPQRRGRPAKRVTRLCNRSVGKQRRADADDSVGAKQRRGRRGQQRGVDLYCGLDRPARPWLPRACSTATATARRRATSAPISGSSCSGHGDTSSDGGDGNSCAIRPANAGRASAATSGVPESQRYRSGGRSRRTPSPSVAPATALSHRDYAAAYGRRRGCAKHHPSFLERTPAPESGEATTTGRC